MSALLGRTTIDDGLHLLDHPSPSAHGATICRPGDMQCFKLSMEDKGPCQNLLMLKVNG